MRLLGNDFWDDIVDINDKHKRRSNLSAQPERPQPQAVPEMDEKRISGLTIFYRVLGTFLLVATMIKSWIWSASLFDWTLMIIGLILIGVHKRFGAEYVIDRVKPAFLDLHNRLKVVESKLNISDESEAEQTKEE
jgi:hypothetical protein